MISIYGITSLMVVSNVVSQNDSVATLECGHTIKTDPGWKTLASPCTVCTAEIKKLVLEHANKKGFKVLK